MKVREFLLRDEFKFVKKMVVGEVERCFSSTNIDAHGDKIELDALESMRKQLENIPWMTLEHTSRCPIGIIKTNSLDIRKMDNGEYGLYGKVDIIDQNIKDRMDRGELRDSSIGATILESEKADKKNE